MEASHLFDTGVFALACAFAAGRIGGISLDTLEALVVTQASVKHIYGVWRFAFREQTREETRHIMEVTCVSLAIGDFDRASQRSL